jgi:ADP-ribose pyrophosphatase
MSDDLVQVRERSTPYRGFMRLDHYKLCHWVYDDEWSVDLSREVLERGHAVSVLPFDPLRDEVVLIEQFRIGAYTAPEMSPWQIECVAGMIEPHQIKEETAHRETEEETGLRILELEPMHKYLSSPGCTSETIHMFCAQVDAEDAGGHYGLSEEGEYIRVFSTPTEEAFEMLDSGRIENGMTIIALQWLRIKRDFMMEKWKIG